jgi:hypothetical protein
VYIVAPREYEAKVSHFLGEYIQEGMSIDLVVVDDMSGSADCLRAVGRSTPMPICLYLTHFFYAIYDI